MRVLPAASDRDRIAAARYQVEALLGWMQRRAKQLYTAQLPYFSHVSDDSGAITSRRRP